MNILSFVMAILLICNIVQGFKKGMVKSVISLISLVVLCVIVALLGNGLRSYFAGEIANVIVLAFLLCLLGIAHHLLGVVFFSAKMIAKLPVIHILDKMLGAVVGALETVLILWTLYTLTRILDMGMIGQQLLEYTRDSAILRWFYEHNELAHWVEHFGAQYRNTTSILTLTNKKQK